jgi:hypothetical protein
MLHNKRVACPPAQVPSARLFSNREAFAKCEPFSLSQLRGLFPNSPPFRPPLTLSDGPKNETLWPLFHATHTL